MRPPSMHIMVLGIAFVAREGDVHAGVTCAKGHA
jgi:hypothetical protein